MTRLESVSPELVGKLQRASAAKQRAASLAACEFAISHAKVEHPLVADALKKLRAGEALTPKQQGEIDTLVARLDDEYFELQEAAEEGRAGRPDEYLQVFGQARAVAALSFAGNRDTFEAVTEAIYEAAATTDDKEELFGLVEATLK